MKGLHKLKLVGKLVGLVVALLGSGSAVAASKALLIGVGDYHNANFNLTGIELDLEIMKRTAMRLGFAENNIKLLTGAAVTKDRLKNQFTRFLSDGVGVEDTVLIYYTGHGVQVTDRSGDEPDNRDEALTLHNLQEIPGGYKGILLDDELSQMLSALPSRNIITIVDACHSGTVTRSIRNLLSLETKSYGVTGFQMKSLPFRGDVNATRSVRGGVSEDAGAEGVVTLSAAQDNQKALATDRGSIFTLALSEAVESTQGNISPRQLISTITGIIQSRVDEDYLFHPNLSGSNARFDQKLKLKKPAKSHSSRNWDASTLLVSKTGGAKASLNKKYYYQEEAITLQFYAPAAGYLNVLAIDQQDSLMLLYPNGFSPDNRVNKGLINLPHSMNFEWVALPPWGPNRILAVFTEEPFNLFNTSLQRSRDGTIEADYLIPSFDTLRQTGFGGSPISLSTIKTVALDFVTCESPDNCAWRLNAAPSGKD